MLEHRIKDGEALHFKTVMVLKTAFLRRPCFQVRDTLLIKTLNQTLTQL